MEKSISEKIKEAGSHTIIYGIGSALQSLLTFVMLPVYTRHYAPETYGILALVMMCATIAGSVFYLGASSALSRSYFDYSDGLERKKTISTSFYMTLSGACMQIVVGYLISGLLSQYLFKTSEYSSAIAVMMVASALGFINTFFYLVLRFQRRSTVVVVVNIISFVLTAGLILFFLLVQNLGVMAPVIGACLGQLVVSLVLFLSVRKSIILDYSRHELAVQLRFGIPTIFVGLAGYALLWIDSFFINRYCTLGDVGIYSAASKIGMMIQALFVVPFSQIWAPMRMEYRHHDNAPEFYRIIVTYYFIIGMLALLFVSVFSREIIVLVTGNVSYFQAYGVIPIVMLAYLIYGVINMIDNGIMFSRKVIYHAYIFCGAVLLKAALCWLFIPRYGYLAAAYITLVSYTVTVFLVYVVSSRLYPVELEVRRLFKIGFCCVASYIIASIVPSDIGPAFYIIRAVIVLLTLGLVSLIVLNEREKMKISKLFRGLIWA